MKKRKGLQILLVPGVVLMLSGCSHTIFEREKDASKPEDQGSTTQLQLRGPRAAINHKF